MSFSFGMAPRHLASWGIAAAALARPAITDADSGKQMVVMPAEGARFVPVDPKKPGGAQLAVLRGDPATGPSAMLLKFKKTTGVLHVHSSDYDLVLLQGTMKHWADGDTETTARPLGPGSYWFQPGGQPHADSCLSDECLMFVSWAGKRDIRPADVPKR